MRIEVAVDHIAQRADVQEAAYERYAAETGEIKYQRCSC